MNCAVPDHVNMMVSYTRKKFSTCYNVKDETVFNHKHENVCFVSCREESYQPDYIGELGKKFLEQTKDQNGKNSSSHIFKICLVVVRQFVSCDDLRILGRNYRNNKWKQKIEKMLLIKVLKPLFNVEGNSVPL